MTREEFNQMRQTKKDMVYDWAVEKYGSWDRFKEECWIEGCIFGMPVNIIPPATHGEWMEAVAGGSYTDGIIEVENSWVRGFVLNDGHNRLKTYISEGVEIVKVKFIK